MKVNFGFFLSKVCRFLNRPALRNCELSRSARIGTGSNLIHVKMGEFSYCGKNCSVLDTEIGSFCSIASYCAIGGAAHPLINVSTSPVFSRGRNVFGENLGNLSTSDSNYQRRNPNRTWGCYRCSFGRYRRRSALCYCSGSSC